MSFMRDLIKYARANAGLDKLERSDEEIIEIDLHEALDTLSNLAPMRRLYSINLVGGQTFYDLPDPSIRSIELSENHRFEFSDEFPLYQWWRRSSSTSTLYGPAGYYSTPMIAYVAAEMYSAGTFEFNVEVRGDKIRVYPTPEGSEAGELKFIGRAGWDLRTEEGVGTGNGSNLTFPLSERDGWHVSVTVAGAQAYDDDWTLKKGDISSNAVLEFVTGAAPASGAAVVVKYLKHDAMDLIPQRLRRCLRLLLASEVARAVAQRRARIPKVQIGPHKMDLGWKALLDHSKDLAKRARSDGGITTYTYQVY